MSKELRRLPHSSRSSNARIRERVLTSLPRRTTATRFTSTKSSTMAMECPIPPHSVGTELIARRARLALGCEMSRYSKLARTHWPSICFFSFVLLTTFVSFSRAPTSVTVKTPTGWRVVSEAGQVFALALDKDIVWAGGKSGVYKIDRRTGTLIEHIPLGAELALVRSLAVAPDGTVWIGHMNGLTSLSGSQSRTYSDHDGLPGQRVNALLVDSSDLLIVARPTVKVRSNQSCRTIT